MLPRTLYINLTFSFLPNIFVYALFLALFDLLILCFLNFSFNRLFLCSNFFWFSRWRRIPIDRKCRMTLYTAASGLKRGDCIRLDLSIHRSVFSDNRIRILNRSHLRTGFDLTGRSCIYRTFPPFPCPLLFVVDLKRVRWRVCLFIYFDWLIKLSDATSNVAFVAVILRCYIGHRQMFVFRFSDRNLWILIFMWFTEPIRRLQLSVFFLFIWYLGRNRWWLLLTYGITVWLHWCEIRCFDWDFPNLS